MSSIELEKIKKRVQTMVSPKRYGHIEGVVKTAFELAARYGADAEKAKLAGAVHDALRGKTDLELLELAKLYGLPVDEYMRRHPSLLHGPLAAAWAQKELGIEDEEVLEAVRAHTVGDAKMAKLTCVLYLSDAMEPGRKYDGVEELRELSKVSLYGATLLSFRQCEAHLKQRGQLPHPISMLAVRTLETYIKEENVNDTKREGACPVHSQEAGR